MQIKATDITKVRIEDEIGEGTRVRGMVRVYVHPGLYLVSRQKHKASPGGLLWATLHNVGSRWHVSTYTSLGQFDLRYFTDTLAEAQQIALLELHR